MIVNKFGGEIMGDPALVKLAVKQIKSQAKAGQEPAVVVSALKGVTDELVALCDKYDQQKILELEKKHEEWWENFQFSIFQPSADHPQGGNFQSIFNDQFLNLKKDLQKIKEAQDILVLKDKVLSYGEKWSSLLFTELLRQNSINAVRFTGEELGVITDDNFEDANVDYERSIKNIRSKILNLKSKVPVIAGFIGRTSDGKTTTLGRGGSDTTACLVGAALKASKVILWKNVAGVLSADPKIVPSAKTVRSLNYNEAEESGKVIHDKAMRIVRKSAVIVEVSYIQNPRQKTVITYGSNTKEGVKIISAKDNLRLFSITGEKIKHYGALSEIAGVFSQHKVNMTLIRNTRDSLYIVVEKNAHNFNLAERQIQKFGYELKCQDVSMINVIGRLDWHTVEQVNHLLHANCPKVILGAFPYRNCAWLEAVVEPMEAERLVRVFHTELVK